MELSVPGGRREEGGGLEGKEAVPGSLIQWAQPARGAGQKEGYIMPIVDREEMLNLARRVHVGLVVDLPDGGGSVRDAKVDSILHVVRTDSRQALMW